MVAYPQLDELFEGWCCALRNAKDNNDKEHATMGLIAALQVRSGPFRAQCSPTAKAAAYR